MLIFLHSVPIGINWFCVYVLLLLAVKWLNMIYIFLLFNVSAKLILVPCIPTHTSISILSTLGCLVSRKMWSLPSQKSPRMDPNPLLYCFQSRLNDVRPTLRLWIRVQPPPFVSISQKTWKYSVVVPKCNRMQREKGDLAMLCQSTQDYTQDSSITYVQLRCTQKLIFRQFVLARDLVVLAVEGCTVIYGIWKKEYLQLCQNHMQFPEQFLKMWMSYILTALWISEWLDRWKNDLHPHQKQNRSKQTGICTE